MNYRLVDVGFPYKKIMQGRRWVGRVLPHGEGGYYAKLGDTECREATERAAFGKVVALHLGYASEAAMDQRNRAVRAHKRLRGRMLSAVGEAYLRADVRTQMDIVDRAFSTPQGPSLLLQGVSRALFKGGK